MNRTRYGSTIQSLTVAVFVFFNEIVGRIQIQEYLIQQHKSADEYEYPHQNEQFPQKLNLNFEKMYEDMYSIQVVGQKQIFLSNTCIRNCDIK